MGYSKVSSIIKKGKGSAFLFVLFLLFSVLAAKSVFAYDWSEVLSAYLSVPINYPDSSAWIEKTPLGEYNVWKRPTDSVWKEQIKSTAYAGQTILSDSNNINYLVLCSDNGQMVRKYEVTDTFRRTLANSLDQVSCMTDVISTGPLADSYEYVSYSYIAADGCPSLGLSIPEMRANWLLEHGNDSPPPVDQTVYDCKSYDVLVNTFPDTVNNCENRTLSMSVDGSIDVDPLITNSCQCTPAGTKYTEKLESGKCRYKNIVGDPTDPNTFITITAPGFTIMDSSPPVTTQVTNPDGTVTVTDTVTNTYPDSTQSQDSTSVTTYPDNSTSTDITTGANIIGGVAIGGTNTNTITSGDKTLSTTTYPSTLQVTTSTVGATTTTTLTKKDADGGGGGDIWAEPPATVTIPSIPSASSHASEYSTDRPSVITDEQVTEKDIKTLIGDFIATSPLVSAVQNTRIETIDSECSFTSGDVFGSPVTLDFCSLDYMFQIFGVLFVIICTFRSFFILFGID